MTAFTCSLCGCALSGGADTFGDYDDPLCRPCYLGEFDPRDRVVSVFVDVDKSWLVEQQPLYRIAYCGYEDGYQWPDGWTAYRWKGPSGYAGQNRDGDNQNCQRETVWFSRHCLGSEQQLALFEWEPPDEN